jgi:hypothetical protein
MATTRIRKQKKPAAGGGYETLYTVGGTDAVISSVRVTNTNAAVETWWFRNRALGAAASLEHQGYTAQTIAGYGVFIFTIGETALATDVFEVASTNGYVTFHLFAQENS